MLYIYIPCIMFFIVEPMSDWFLSRSGLLLIDVTRSSLLLCAYDLIFGIEPSTVWVFFTHLCM